MYEGWPQCFSFVLVFHCYIHKTLIRYILYHALRRTTKANWLKEQFRNFVTLCNSLIFCAINLFLKKCGLCVNYSAILNISRKCSVTLMKLSSQSEETLLRIREHSLSCGASQLAVRRRWLSLYTVWPSHSQWPSEQISFITTMRLPFYSSRVGFFFWQSITSPKSVKPPTAQIWLPATSGFSQS